MQTQQINAKAIKVGDIIAAEGFCFDPEGPTDYDLLALVLSNNVSADGKIELTTTDGKGDCSGDGIFPTAISSYSEDQELTVIIPDKSADPQIKVRTTASAGQWTQWQICQNITDRWGEVNFHAFSQKPLHQLAIDQDLYKSLVSSMQDEITFIVRKDSKFGLLFELEFVSRESEESMMKDRSPAEWERLARHDVVIAGLLRQLPRLELMFPGVDFSLPDEDQIVENRPAIWAFVPHGLFNYEELSFLSKCLFEVDGRGTSKEVTWNVDLALEAVVQGPEAVAYAAEGDAVFQLVQRLRKAGFWRNPKLETLKIQSEVQQTTPRKTLKESKLMLNLRLQFRSTDRKMPDVNDLMPMYDRAAVFESIYPGHVIKDIELSRASVTRDKNST